MSSLIPSNELYASSKVARIDHINREAMFYAKMNNFAKAADIYRAALAETPDHPALMNNLAGQLNKMGECDEAIDLCGKVISRHPEVGEPFITLGLAHRYKHQYVQAVAAMQIAAERCPNNAMPKFNLGTMALMGQSWEEGWAAYDFRFAAKGRQLHYHPGDLWLGEDGTEPLTIWGEQGIGDEIMQLSMASDLLAHYHGPIHWEVEPRLVELAQRSFPQIAFEARQERLMGAKGHVRNHYPAQSLGGLFRKTTEQFTARAYLKTGVVPPDPDRKTKRVGISWHSRKAQYGNWKSSPLSAWEPLLNCGAEIYSLQYEPYAQGNEIEQHPQVKVQRPLDTLNDISGVARLAATCDVIVTVSNTVAHLAGAIGIPTIVLLPNFGSMPWCWGHEDTTPWYPSVTVMRMHLDENWDELLVRATRAVEEML